MEEKSKTAEIVIFDNPQFGQIRTTINEKGEPLFALADVCDALDLKNSSRVQSRLPQKGISSIETTTNRGVQKLTYVNEPNLYRCVFQSRKTTAEAFQDWIFEDVLPSLRRTGSYTVGLPAPALPTETRLTMTLQESALVMADALSNGHRHDFFDYLQLTMMPASFYTVATDYGWTVITLLDTLHDIDVMEKGKVSGKEGITYWLNPLYSEKGYLQNRKETEYVMIGENEDREVEISFNQEWTPKGRCFIYGALKKIGILPIMERNLLFLSQPKK